MGEFNEVLKNKAQKRGPTRTLTKRSILWINSSQKNSRTTNVEIKFHNFEEESLRLETNIMSSSFTEMLSQPFCVLSFPGFQARQKKIFFAFRICFRRHRNEHDRKWAYRK